MDKSDDSHSAFTLRALQWVNLENALDLSRRSLGEVGYTAPKLKMVALLVLTVGVPVLPLVSFFSHPWFCTNTTHNNELATRRALECDMRVKPEIPGHRTRAPLRPWWCR